MGASGGRGTAAEHVVQRTIDGKVLSRVVVALGWMAVKAKVKNFIINMIKFITGSESVKLLIIIKRFRRSS